MDFFDDFDLEMIDVNGVTLRVRRGGEGPPLVLLHGHPRTHTTWHAVAARLAARFVVVCPDLRGYGGSSKPEVLADHSQASKRAAASDVVQLMRRLGFPQFGVAGHDRGAYVATRLALDHPLAVSRLAVLDAVPIGEALARATSHFAQRWWHWFFYGQTKKPAERYISADPHGWYGGDPQQMGTANFEDYARAIADPATVLAMMEDYRAGLTVDRAHDDADRAAGRRIEAPVLVAWSSRDDLEDLYGDPVEVWQSWASDVRGVRIDSGHHMAEEAPDALADALAGFFAP